MCVIHSRRRAHMTLGLSAPQPGKQIVDSGNAVIALPGSCHTVDCQIGEKNILRTRTNHVRSFYRRWQGLAVMVGRVAARIVG
jgi:hypothetical protein